MEARQLDSTVYFPSEGAMRLKGYVYCPDTNEELAVLSRSPGEGVGGSETMYYPADYAKGLINSFEKAVAKGSGVDSIEQPASDSIESLASFRKHSASREAYKEDTSTLLKQGQWFDLFETLVYIAAFGRPVELIMATKKLLSFMRLQGLSSYDQEDAYKSDFFMNYPIAWKGAEECTISIARVLMRIAHLLILRCLYPGLQDVTNICKRFVTKIMLLLVPASEWLDLTEHDGSPLDDVTLANFCLGQQTLYFTKKLGASLLHSRDKGKARLLSHLCSTKFMGHPGSLVKETELANTKLARGIVLKDYRSRNNVRSIMSMYEPSDFPLDETKELIVGKVGAGGYALDQNVMRKLTSYLWNDLMFSSRKRRRRDFDSKGRMNAKVSALMDKIAPIVSSSDDGYSGQSGDSEDNDMDEEEDEENEEKEKEEDGTNIRSSEFQEALRDEKFISEALTSDSYKYRRESRSSEALFSGDKLRIFHTEVLNHTKNTKLATLIRNNAAVKPYPQAGMDLVFEKFLLGRSLGNTIFGYDGWKQKNCGISGSRDPPLAPKSKHMQPTLVCSECARPFHQSCIRSLFGTERPCILLGDTKYTYTCSDCSIMARHIGRLPSKKDVRPDIDNIAPKQRTLLDAAIIAISILIVEFNYQYTLFDIRQVWDTIKKYWKELQPLVLILTDTTKSSMFLSLEDERSIAKLDKREAKTRLLTLLRSHPVFIVKEEKEGKYAAVGFSKRFRPHAYSLLPPRIDAKKIDDDSNDD